MDRGLLPSEEAGEGGAWPSSGAKVKGKGRPPRPALLGEESRSYTTLAPSLQK